MKPYLFALKSEHVHAAMRDFAVECMNRRFPFMFLRVDGELVEITKAFPVGQVWNVYVTNGKNFLDMTHEDLRGLVEDAVYAGPVPKKP